MGLEQVTFPEFGSGSSSTDSRKAAMLSPRQIPKSGAEIHELAKHMAFGAVTGYLEHDRAYKENRPDRVEKAVDGFFQVYLYCFPEMSPLRLYRAAELYVQSLFKQDEIEDYPGHSRDEILDDPKWSEVREILCEFSNALELPESYAEHATNFFRHHGVRDPRWVIHCLEAENVFWTKVIGNDYWSRMLGSLLILLTDCHDKHDQVGLEAGLDFATRYFEIAVKALSSKQSRLIVSPV